MRASDRRLVALLLVATLVACGAPQPPAVSTIDGTIARPAGAPAPLGVAVVVFDDIEPPGGLPSSVIEFDDGYYAGPVGSVGADGRFTLTFPDGASLPPGVFAPADDFLLNARRLDACQLTASDPAARVTTAFFDLITLPGITILTADGLMFGITTDRPLGFDLEGAVLADFAGHAFQTWVYADRAVGVGASGDGCTTQDMTFLVDVTLAEGWNVLSWTVTVDADSGRLSGVALRDGEADEVFVIGIFP
jgi:hypothetical protein